jgi:spore germination protein Q
MSTQFPPEGWPYGAAFNAGDGQPDFSRQQVPPAAGTGSFPFQAQIAQPTQPQPAMPFPFPSFTTPAPQAPPAAPPTGQPQPAAPVFVEQSYIENILRLNLGKTASVYCTFEGNTEWNAKVFTGTVEAAGRDHVIIKDASSETRFLIPMVFVNYVTFEGPMNYSYPFAPAQPGGRP